MLLPSVFHRVLLSVLAAICLSGLLARAGAAEADPNFHLYLLIGQSNMAGRGVPDAESKQPHPRVLVLTKERKWEPATDPLHFDKPIAGVGPGLTFGKVMAEANAAVKIGLVPCAMGGSKIEEWAPGTKNRTAMLDRMREAAKAGVLKGIVWHQGESNLNGPANYADQLTQFVAEIRQELGATEVPFVAGEITAFKPDRAKIDAFNAGLHALEKRIPKFRCVKTQELKDKGDQLHFDTASARELGRRYAAAMLDLQK